MMIRAHDRIDSFAWRNGGLMSWLYAILREGVADYQRSTGRHSAKPPDVTVLDLPMSEEASSDANEIPRIQRAFARLDRSEQDVLELRVLGGLDPDQIGIVLGERPGVVRTAQSRALAKLGMIVREESDDE
jgi:RNA polymerase sigma-70 factor (ECF subfamily)